MPTAIEMALAINAVVLQLHSIVPFTQFLSYMAFVFNASVLFTINVWKPRFALF